MGRVWNQKKIQNEVYNYFLEPKFLKINQAEGDNKILRIIFLREEKLT